MSPLDDFPELSSPEKFEAAIPQELKNQVDAMTPAEVTHRFDYLWSCFLDRDVNRPSLEERQEYFLLKKRYLKIVG